MLANSSYPWPLPAASTFGEGPQQGQMLLHGLAEVLATRRGLAPFPLPRQDATLAVEDGLDVLAMTGRLPFSPPRCVKAVTGCRQEVACSFVFPNSVVAFPRTGQLKSRRLSGALEAAMSPEQSNGSGHFTSSPLMATSRAPALVGSCAGAMDSFWRSSAGTRPFGLDSTWRSCAKSSWWALLKARHCSSCSSAWVSRSVWPTSIRVPRALGMASSLRGEAKDMSSELLIPCR
mmetsp:Transcript_7993/g.17274  ORF Transcript_7993/g.17274 Transcript_7993/m.17274 type:complete len:233 (+) Transcript_7993:73-771(+)